MKTYSSFINTLGANAHVDLQIYHCDETLFLNILDKFEGAYDYYVITTHFKTDELKHLSFTDEVVDAIKKIPQEKFRRYFFFSVVFLGGATAFRAISLIPG